MKVCICGAGAIGITLGVRLGLAGHDISVLARGDSLRAISEQGLRLEYAGETLELPVMASDQAAKLGPQDLVILAVKAPAMAAVAATVGGLIGPETQVLTAMNGIPWWFFDGLTGPLAGATLATVDPGKHLRQQIPTRHVLGAVLHMACARLAPGHARHNFGAGVILGEATGGGTPRAEALVAALTVAGFDASLSPRIQVDLWYKLWGNMTHNPVSALTGATSDLILDDARVMTFCAAIMEEAAAVGRLIGCPVDQTPAERHQVTRQLGAFKTSMLQDAEAGRPLEYEALIGAVVEIADRLGLACPHMSALYGLIRLYDQAHGQKARPDG